MLADKRCFGIDALNTLTGFRFHHFGLAAVYPEKAVTFAATLGYECGPSVFDPLQDVHLRWCLHPAAPALEIVSPASPDGPLKRILLEQPSSFYHLCYAIMTDTATALEQLRANGRRVITVMAPVPAVLFGGRKVSFHTVHGFGLLELLEAGSASDGNAS